MLTKDLALIWQDKAEDAIDAGNLFKAKSFVKAAVLWNLHAIESEKSKVALQRLLKVHEELINCDDFARQELRK